MKTLIRYLYEFEGATSLNTMGMGNPYNTDDIMSEPIQTNHKNKKRTSKKKFLKNKS